MIAAARNYWGRLAMTVHVPEPKTIESQPLAQIFTEARTHNVFHDKPVSDELLREGDRTGQDGADQRQSIADARSFPAIARGQGAASASSVARQSG